MLERPDLTDQRLAACLREAYGLAADRVAFLPLGADPNTAVFRIDDHFVKLRRGPFDEVGVALPRFLHDQGIAAVIAPCRTKAGRLWTRLDPFTVVVYPFIVGRDGYAIALTETQWRAFGAAVRAVHDATPPDDLYQCLPRETFGGEGREAIQRFLARPESDVATDVTARQTRQLLREQHAAIVDLVERAERLAQALRQRPLDLVLCHTDLHPGNLLLADDGALYLVDWDAPLLAPKERDLMFPGGGLGFVGRTPPEEVALFLAGYGAVSIDSAALAYYRYERIVQDIAEFCEQLLSTDEGGDDRAQSLRYLRGNFAPGGTIEAAYSSDRT